jgi:hypothetical protein
MAKVNGIPVTFTIDTTSGTPTDISDIVGECTVNTSRALQDVTGLDKDGTERITLRGDVTVDITGFEDDGTRIDDIFLDPANLRTTTIVFPNRTFGPAELVIGTFNETRGADGSIGWTAQLSQADGASLADLWS